MPLVLYGRDLSPFARRVAIWLALQGREVERRPLMVTGDDFETLKAINPLGRVPALVLEDGAVLTETWAILDWLEETAPTADRLLPASGTARRTALQHLAHANSTAEKGVALVYEHNRRPEEYRWPEWRARLEGQIAGGLAAIEAMAPADGWIGGEAPNGADIGHVVLRDFLRVTSPRLLEPGYPKLEALADRAAGLPAFSASAPQV